MSYLDHDLGPEGATRAPDRPIQRTPAPSPVLDLQRLAGNAAVSQAMQSGRLGSSVTVQREDEDADEDEAMEEEEEEVSEAEETVEEEEEEAG